MSTIGRRANAMQAFKREEVKSVVVKRWIAEGCSAGESSAAHGCANAATRDVALLHDRKASGVDKRFTCSISRRRSGLGTGKVK